MINYFLMRFFIQLETGGYTENIHDPSPEPSSHSVAIQSNMFKPAVPPRSPDTRLSRSNLSLSGGSPRSPQDSSAAVRSNLGFGYHYKATTHLSPSFINNTTTRMDKDLETRFKSVKLNQNGSGKQSSSP